MKDFGKIVEEWATKYKPMQHVPGETSKNKRFFLIDSIVSLPDFMKNITSTNSPCVAYEFYVKAGIHEGIIKPTYTVYFLVDCGTSKPNKVMASKAVTQATDHALKFLAWIRKQQDIHPELRNIEVDDVEMDTFGPLLNGWYSVFLEFQDTDNFNLCVDPEDYVD